MKAMEEWRAKALEMLPELEEEIREAAEPMRMWIEIELEFDNAYDEKPPNSDLIARIYHFAFWCMERDQRDDSADEDLPTCVAVCFYEHIPLIELARADLPHWFSRADIVGMKDIFSYHLEDGEFEKVLALYGGTSKSKSIESNQRKKRCKR